MQASSILPILLVMVSPAIGSFLAVLIDRLPRGLDVVRPRSTCGQCRTRLSPVELVPLLSYMALRGKCRHCGAVIPPWLLLTELVAVLVACLAVMLGQTPAEMVLIAVLFWLCWTLAMCDLLHFRLPDPLTASLALAAFLWAVLRAELATALIGAIAGSASFWLLRLAYRQLRQREGLGLGDVKLMAGLGALVGVELLPLTVLIAALVSLVWAYGSTGGWAGNRALPFGAALAASGAAVWLGMLAGN